MLIRKYQKQLILGLGLLSVSLFVGNAFAISEQDLNAAKVAKAKAEAVAKAKAEAAARLRNSVPSRSSGSAHSIVDVDSYAGRVKEAIQNEFGYPDVFRGRTCELQLKLAPNGSLVSVTPKNNSTNDAALCNAAIKAVELARFPKPPSVEVYNAFNKVGSTIVFKP